METTFEETLESLKGIYSSALNGYDIISNGYKIKLYENDRHEIYNELNKQEVYDNTLNFIESII